MSIRADWKLSELDLAADDPFATVILSSGLEVDLTGGAEAIHAGLVASLAVESSLFNKGITCGLKDAGQDCLTCSSYDSKARLCRLGRDQRTLEQRVTQLEEQRTGPFREMMESAVAFAESSYQYAELLAVGS